MARRARQDGIQASPRDRGDGRLIGELAAEFGLNPKTLRYYEAVGLLPPPSRTAAGYRLYGRTDRERLRFVLKARAIGLSLSEVREVLAIRQRGEPPCMHVLQLLDRKVAQVDRQMHALAAFRRELLTLRQKARRNVSADACVCGIIERHGATMRRTTSQGEHLWQNSSSGSS